MTELARDVFAQDGYQVRFEWGHEGVARLGSRCGAVVVVDVLTFSTAVSVAVERDVRVVPFRWGDERAGEAARAAGAVLAGPRSGAGPSLSPGSLATLAPGALLVLPSPNGSTCCAMAAEAGAAVVAGCLRNARATGRWLHSALEEASATGWAGPRRSAVAVVAAGERWPSGALRPALEDLVGAGAVLASAIAGGLRADLVSPEARLAIAAHEAIGDELPSFIDGSVSGQELIGRGFRDDVRLALERDATDRVPLLVDGAFVSRT